MAAIPEDQEYPADKGRPAHEIFVLKTVILHPWLQN